MPRFVLLLCFSSFVVLPIVSRPAWAADPPAVEASEGMVVAAERHAVEVGVEILRSGGNAVDAAVAVGFALAVTFPEAGNLGGGGFLVLHTATDPPREIALDFREIAPAAAHEKLYVEAAAAGKKDASRYGALASGVPGSVAGLLYALDRWGTLEPRTVLAPAIRLANDGFPLGRRTHQALANEKTAEAMQRTEATQRLFYPEGRPLAEGARLVQIELARTLQAIAEDGFEGFYQGWVAEAIVDDQERNGGVITLADLRGYEPALRKPITFSFRKHRIITMPPPSSGGVCLQQMLGMLEQFPLETFGPRSSATRHLLAESMRRSFADRNRYLGDPDHHTLPLGKILAPEYIARLARSIRPGLATPSAKILEKPLPVIREGEETTHYSIVDAARNAVSVTTTLNSAFGNKCVVPGAGFLMNNEMDDFAAEPGKPNLYGLVQGRTNAVVAGARPLSSMTPTIVLDDQSRVRHVVGSPGGPTIITNVLQVLLNLIVFDLPPQSAVNAPKIHHQCLPDVLFHEREIAADVLEALRRRGHTLRARGPIGDVQLITVDPEKRRLYGASDPRRGGVARGL